MTYSPELSYLDSRVYEKVSMRVRGIVRSLPFVVVVVVVVVAIAVDLVKAGSTSGSR